MLVKIEEWKNRPIPGGWSIRYKIKDNVVDITGDSPQEVVTNLVQVQKNNRVYSGWSAAWELCNSIWCKRCPERCTDKKYLASSVEESSLTNVKARSTHMTRELYGKYVWQFLHILHLCWSPQYFLDTIDWISELLDPRGGNLNTGCMECYSHWIKLLETYPPSRVKTQKQMCEWAWKVHNDVNRMAGKPHFSYEQCKRVYGAL